MHRFFSFSTSHNVSHILFHLFYPNITRLYFLPFEVLRSVLFESSYSYLDMAKDPTGEKYAGTVRIYAGLIGALCVLHYLWFWMMLQKSYREVFGEEKKKK